MVRQFRVPHFATKYRNIVSQLTLRLILFSMVSVFTLGSGRIWPV